MRAYRAFLIVCVLLALYFACSAIIDTMDCSAKGGVRMREVFGLFHCYAADSLKVLK